MEYVDEVVTVTTSSNGFAESEKSESESGFRFGKSNTAIVVAVVGRCELE